jgi:hypothetical protein
MNTLAPANLATTIEKAWETWIVANSQKPASESSEPFIQANVWAGQLGNCARQMYYNLLYSNEKKPWTPEQLTNFRRGKDRERDIVADMKRIGRESTPAFEVVEEESRVVLKDRKGRVCITGKVDLKIRFSDMDRHAPAIPAEVKSWSQGLISRVRTFADLLDNKYTRRGATQLLGYLFGTGQETGLMILDRHGIPMFLPVNLWDHAHLIEAALQRAEAAMDAKEGGPEPDYTSDVEECGICQFMGSRCTPPRLAGQGASIITDEEVIQLLEIRDKADEAATEYDRADKILKKRLRGTELAVAGNFLVEGSWGSLTKTVVPPEYEALAESWKEVDPQGRFTLKISRINK